MTKRQRKAKLANARLHQTKCRERNRLSKPPTEPVATIPATSRKRTSRKKWLRRIGRKIRPERL